MCRHLPLAVKIALVSDNNHREVVLILHSQDLLLESHDLLKALSIGDGVDKQEAFASPHVLLPHGRVLLLASCVQNIEERYLIVDNTLLAVRICVMSANGHNTSVAAQSADALTLNRRIILVNEMRLDELDSQARLAHSTTSYNH